MFSNLLVQRKISIALLGFGAIFILGLGLFVYLSGRTALVKATVSDLASAAHEKEKALNQWGEHRLEMLIAISGSSAVSKVLISLMAATPESDAARTIRDLVKRKMRTWVGPDKPFNSMLIVDKAQGQVIFSSDEKELGTFKENREYFIKGLKEPVIVGPYFSITRGKAMISAAAPFRNENGLVAGVLVARLNMDEIGAIMRRRGGVNRTFDAYLVNTARLFVSQPRDVHDPAVLVRGNYLPFVNRCLKGESGSDIADDFRGVPVIVAYRWSPELRLCVLAKLDQSEAFRSLRLFGWVTLGGSIFALIAAGFLAVFLSKWITKPILLLHGATRAIGSGDMGVRLEPKGTDEIAQLMHGFNGMVSSLATKDRQIADYTSTLENRVEERTAELREVQSELVKKERLATLGRLAASVSHELRNPLGAISMSLALVDAKIGGRELGVERAIERMKRGVARCDRIIDEMLDFARERDLLFVPTDLDTWLRELLDEQVLPDGITLHYRLNTDRSRINLDPDLFRRAVINLYTNACDAMLGENEDGQSGRAHELVVETRCVNESAEISIIDDGPGMAADVLANAFEPLFSTKNFGVGLGLPIVRKIVEQHSGTIGITSEPGAGTRVTLTIPLQQADAESCRIA